MMLEKETITENIIGSAIEVHRSLGPCLLESVYEECLCHEFGLRSMNFQRQAAIPVEYKGINLNCGYRIDVIVEDTVVDELKSVKKISPVHKAQLLTYMKLSIKSVGLLLNFNVPVLKDGLIRMVL